MLSKGTFGFLLILLFFFCTQKNIAAENSLPRQKIILDADIDSDVDDVGAMAMLLNLHKAGTIELIGVVITSDDPFAPVCASAVNTFYGCADIPVGFLKGQPKLTNHSRYTKTIASEFPSKLKSWEDADEAVGLYRKLLSQNPDESVTIVSIGHLSSLQGLLQSGADQLSPLNGKDLVKKKVDKWICMGGQFPQGKEANFYRPDPQSTVYCLANWEKEVVFCGWEVGNKIITGGERLKSEIPTNHILYRSYELYNNFAGRQSWDQIAVLLLIHQADRFFSFVNGRCVVAPDGSNTWESNPSGKHQYVILNPEINADRIAIFTDDLMIGRIPSAQKPEIKP
ncbi:MAG TPA: nucleoside hydrolase [Prolixibacteraceae bacterium]|nr:nucleoside hydrolase [Prolixibacteraceae bacterium]